MDLNFHSEKSHKFTASYADKLQKLAQNEENSISLAPILHYLADLEEELTCT